MLLIKKKLLISVIFETVCNGVITLVTDGKRKWMQEITFSSEGKKKRKGVRTVSAGQRSYRFW